MAPPKQESNRFWGFPATSLNISNLANARREQEAEQVYRQRLAKGIPSNAPACQKHRNILERQSRGILDGTAAGPDSNATDDTIFLACETIIPLTTALLPHCTLCFYTNNHLPASSSIPEDHDACLCASVLLRSHCIYCSLAALEQKLSNAFGERTRHDVTAAEFLTCECGSQVMLPGDSGELVRKYVGCSGVVMAPFRNWMGDEVMFGRKAALPALVIDGGQRSKDPESLAEREPDLQPPRETVNFSYPRLRQIDPTEETTTGVPRETERASHASPVGPRPRNHASCTSDISPGQRAGQGTHEQTSNLRGRSDSGTAVAPLKDITNQACPSCRLGLKGGGRQKGV